MQHADEPSTAQPTYEVPSAHEYQNGIVSHSEGEAGSRVRPTH